ncbi:MAG TPA: hemerythrin domain-containing protein [Streptosporangiaceae bacterium]|jgi:hemerythrin-like domain-containing protein|nr:hemerythrin domain-containing protein [Streptosporangiaceae bacterium]
MADLFEILRSDHGDVQLLLAALENSPGHAAGATQAVLRARKAAAERLVIDSARHEAAEEEYIWPAVRAQLGHGNQLADQASAQEMELMAALARLDKLEADDDQFDELLAELIPATRRHLEFEETRIWPEMRTAFSPLQARELGNKVAEAAERTAAGRPGGRKPAGSAQAAAGKLNGAVSRRRAAG